MNIIKIKDVYKDYLLNKITVNALSGINLLIETGEFSAIVGPSGSGKSTLIHLIGCLDTITKGEIFLDNENVSSLSKKELAEIRKEKIGIIFQAYNLIPVLTVFENVSFPLTLSGYDSKYIKEKVYRVLEQVGLKSLDKRKPGELSGGQQQRVAIARALVKKPQLILADEPTANIDSKTGREIMNLMLEINKNENTTFVFSTHDKMVMDYARRIIILQDGQIIEDKKK